MFDLLELICYFFPAILTLWIFESFTRQKLSLKRCIYRFCGNALLINFFCFILNTFLIKMGTALTHTTAFYYLVMAIPFGVILAVIESVLADTTKLTIEENIDEATKDESEKE